jgi:hypothetical protein
MMNELRIVKIWHLLPKNLYDETAILECCGKPFGEVWALARFAPTKVGFTTEQPTCTKGQQ